MEKVAAEIEAEAPPAPEQPQAPETAVEQPQAQQEQPQRPPQGFVPLAALQRARHDAAEKIRALEARLSELDKRTAPKPEAPPDPKLDPIGYLDWLNKNQTTQQTEQQKQREAEERATAERAEREQVINYYHEDADYFRDTTPDFDDAYQHFVRYGMETLKAQGIRNPMQRSQMQAAAEFDFVREAIARQMSPAEVIYEKAKQLGWQAGGGQQAQADPAPQMQQPLPPRNQQGQFTAPAPTPQAPRSLSQARGGSVPSNIEQKLLNARGREFDEVVKSQDDWRRLHGR